MSRNDGFVPIAARSGSEWVDLPRALMAREEAETLHHLGHVEVQYDWSSKPALMLVRRKEGR